MPAHRTFPYLGPLGLAVIGVMIAGFMLRIAAAQGGLWVDEAWSAVYAAKAGTALGVFTAINHDNNHHLNSLWMQLVGLSAPPVLTRGLSIVMGTTTIAVAAAIGVRRSRAQAIVMAALFAFAPILVHYGSEARGYAGMVLAVTGAFLMIDRWLDRPDRPPPAWGLAAISAFGLLSHLTFAFALPAIAGWAVMSLMRSMPLRAALSKTQALLIPSLLATLLVIIIVAGAAAASATGMQVGGLEPHSFASFVEALDIMAASTLGMPFVLPGAFAVAALAAMACIALVSGVRPRAAFYLLAIIAFPCAIMVLQIGNSSFPRYYLISAVALLVLLAEVAGAALATAGWRRAAAIATLSTLFAGGMIDNAALIDSKRADPSAAVSAMASIIPAGTTVLVDNERPTAVLRVAAIQAGYPLKIAEGCPAFPFLFVEGVTGNPSPRVTQRCGQSYTRIASRDRSKLSGMNWALYRLTGRSPTAMPPTTVGANRPTSNGTPVHGRAT